MRTCKPHAAHFFHQVHAGMSSHRRVQHIATQLYNIPFPHGMHYLSLERRKTTEIQTKDAMWMKQRHGNGCAFFHASIYLRKLFR
mmetsp:Transcript_44497/g.85122  ORF Transcript_44497/g.85122 Transcript_44497/m.85122 type:complete len:85 (+) Transcript_44497:1175-1429(+)